MTTMIKSASAIIMIQTSLMRPVWPSRERAATVGEAEDDMA